MTAVPPAGPRIGLLDYAWVLYKRRRLIGLLGAAACLISLVVSLLLPKVYEATASVLPPQQLSSFMTPWAGQAAVGGLGGGLGSLLGQKGISELWEGILRSRTVADAIIKRFGLKERDQTSEEARQELAERVAADSSRAGIVSVTVEDKDPRRAAAMANAFVEELRLVVTRSGGRTRAFTEQRLVGTRQALKRAEDALRVFQERNRAVKIDAQSEAIIGAFGKLKVELAAKRVELNTLLSQVTASHPRVKVLESEIAEMGEQLRQMEEGGAGRNDIFLPTDRVPNLGVQYGRLLREVKYQETLFELLSQQYEMARIQEAKDTPTVQVLDVATVPEEKAKPRRTLIVLLATTLALTAGAVAAFFLEYLEARGLWPREAEDLGA